MKRTLMAVAPAIALALWLAGSAERSAAQSAAESTAEPATSAATDTGATTGAADTATSATVQPSSTADAAASTAVTSPESDTAATATGSTQADGQATTQPQAGVDASAATGATADAQTPPTPSSIQADASGDAAFDAGRTTDPAQPENAATPSAVAGAATSADIAAQGQAGVTAGANVAAQQNLQAGLEFGQATDRGLAINNIARDHFFFNSGLRPRDVIVSYAGRPIRTQADFARWVVFQPGQRVPVVVLRDGRPQTILVTYQAQQPGFETQAGYAPAPGGAYLGVSFDPQSPQQAIVRTVNPGSPAERAGIRPGDVIFAINGNRVGGSQDVIRIVSSMQPGEPIDVAISRQVVLGSRPGVAQAAYAPGVRVQSSTVTPAVPAVPVVPAPAAGTFVDPDVDVVAPGGARFDNTPARAGDVDRDGLLLDDDGRVGPVEGRAILPRRRN